MKLRIVEDRKDVFSVERKRWGFWCKYPQTPESVDLNSYPVYDTFLKAQEAMNRYLELHAFKKKVYK